MSSRISDDEWTFFEGFIRAARHSNGRKPADHRLVLDGISWITRTGAPWRDLPKEFGKWSSVYRQFRRWTLAGLWEDTLRNMVERCFNNLKNSRRLATRYDKTAESFLGFVDVACIRLWLRHLST
ncbi:transposase [Gemmobacter sp. 24YEA27]|uniref:transposase n=1 Tax=Gemmobacter sp. 24YEA27 TaxID=3040672 RepID=UPI0024B3976C|nr:transposase [Gemmobacter sp. 24YEA27]